MARLIFSGLFDALPDLKIVTHHMGGMIPFFAEKIAIGFEQLFEGGVGNNPLAARAGLKKQPIDYYRMLYGDTALNGSRPATVCGYDFFGAGQSLFATDAPFDPEGGALFIRGTIDAVDFARHRCARAGADLREERSGIAQARRGLKRHRTSFRPERSGAEKSSSPVSRSRA